MELQNVDVEAYSHNLELPQEFQVDPEPTSLRLALVVILFVGMLSGCFLTSVVFDVVLYSILTILGGIIFGAVVLQIAEKTLKPRWKSDHFVHVDRDAIYTLMGGARRQEIDPTQQVNIYMWRFIIHRRSRVSKGWFVVAIALEQDDVYLPVFTFASPEVFANIPLTRQFTKLLSKKERDGQYGGKDSLRVTGQQRRLLTAESARDLHGVEMENDDFVRYLQLLQSNFSKWMPSD
jgi:hypothetical protein